MSIVFVHGVNNRRSDSDYAEEETARRQYFSKLFCPNVGIAEDKISSPYWGDSGVGFRWNGASSKEPSNSVSLSLSAASQAQAPDFILLRNKFLNTATGTGIDLAGIAASDFVASLDLIWDVASATAVDGSEHLAVAELARKSYEYAELNPNPAWISECKLQSTSVYLSRLVSELGKMPNSHVSLGLSDALSQAREKLDRLVRTPSTAATSAFLSAFRAQINSSGTRFAGDIFQYLTTRGTVESPGSIVNIVADQLKADRLESNERSEPLVVIGHSLGGVLTYDILSHFAPDVEVDCFVTVGSQVSLFAEMDLYARKVDSSAYANPVSDRISTPSNIKNWLNVYDSNDVFSYVASGVFNRVKDYSFETGYGLLGSHGGYFRRPSFYNRLAQRVSKLLGIQK